MNIVYISRNKTKYQTMSCGINILAVAVALGTASTTPQQKNTTRHIAPTTQETNKVLFPFYNTTTKNNKKYK